MKTPIVIVLALVAAAFAGAADLALKDGRVLRDAVITKQDPTTVTVRHAEGFTQVEKSKLPDELAPQYPIDEAAAAKQREAELARATRISAEQERKADAIAHSSRPGGAQAVSAPATRAFASDDLQRAQHAPRNDRERYLRYRVNFSAPIPSDFNPAFANWTKLYEANGRGAPMDIPLSITKRVFRIRCQFVSQGQYSFLSARVQGDDVFACAWLEQSNDGCVYGTQGGDVKLIINSQRGGWSVIVEESDG